MTPEEMGQVQALTREMLDLIGADQEDQEVDPRINGIRDTIHRLRDTAWLRTHGRRLSSAELTALSSAKLAKKGIGKEDASLTSKEVGEFFGEIPEEKENLSDMKPMKERSLNSEPLLSNWHICEHGIASADCWCGNDDDDDEYDMDYHTDNDHVICPQCDRCEDCGDCSC